MNDFEMFDILSLISELAIAFAGFTGIAALFGSVRSNDLLRMRLTALMMSAFGALMMSLLPMTLAAFSISDSTIWLSANIALAPYALITLTILTPWAIRLRRENKEILSLPPLMFGYILPIMGSLSGLAGIFVAESREGFFVAGLAIYLAACIFMFVRIIFTTKDRDVAA